MHQTPSFFRRAPLALALSLTFAWPLVAQAQTPVDDRVSQLAIAAQPLGAALNALSAATGVPIAFSPEWVAGKMAPALQGSLPLGQALALLLADSGLEAVRQGETMVVQPLRPRTETTLRSVEVAAPAVYGVTQNLSAKVGAGALGQVTQKDTPFSSAVISNEQILEQASQKLGELFIQDASVSDNSGPIPRGALT